jgi:hypothetical protein
LLGFLCSVSACHYYEEFRVLKSTADLKEEQAEMMRAHRECLQKYEAEPAKARDHCAPYTQTLRELDIKRQTIH